MPPLRGGAKAKREALRQYTELPARLITSCIYTQLAIWRTSMGTVSLDIILGTMDCYVSGIGLMRF